MRWRVVAWISLGVNLALAALWIALPVRAPVPTRTTALANANAQDAAGRARLVVRRQFFSWHDLESPDYPIYIANLRAIGCPEQTIKDIIIADVNSLYSRRLATELVTPEQQWWRSEPDTNVMEVAAEKARDLDDERRALLSRLLGSNWEAGDLVNLPRPSKPGVVLDGPVLGTLSTETKQSLQDINARSEARLQAYLAEQRQDGKPPDPVQLAKLRQETRQELASVLAPAQLEEYLLRYSEDANSLRAEFGQLQYFNPTPEEFRAVFRATDNIDQQIQLLADSTDPASIQARASLEAQKQDAIKTALGAGRYADYQMLHDPLYRQAVAAADAAGTPEAARTMYQVSLAALSTQNAIQSDPNLTDSQKAVELKQLELEQLKANTLAAGQELPPEPPQAPTRRSYTLREGDTPSVVAMIYGIPESAIRAANPNVDFARLRPGDSIYLPGAALNPTPVSRTPYGP